MQQMQFKIYNLFLSFPIFLRSQLVSCLGLGLLFLTNFLGAMVIINETEACYFQPNIIQLNLIIAVC